MTLDVNGGMRIGQLTSSGIDLITCDANKLGTLIFDTDEDIVKVCRSGGWSIFETNCDATTEIVNGHTYSVPAIDYGLSTGVTSASYSISNGDATSDQTFVCNDGPVNVRGGERNLRWTGSRHPGSSAGNSHRARRGTATGTDG